jgi:hypothetical protein
VATGLVTANVQLTAHPELADEEKRCAFAGQNCVRHSLAPSPCPATAQDWDHAGSGGRYMAHKNRKLHEQFAEVAARKRAGWVPQKEEDATLFQGVS